METSDKLTQQDLVDAQKACVAAAANESEAQRLFTNAYATYNADPTEENGAAVVAAGVAAGKAADAYRAASLKHSVISYHLAHPNL